MTGGLPKPRKGHSVKALVQLPDGRYVVRCTCSVRLPAEVEATKALDNWGSHIWTVAFSYFPQPTLF